MNQPRPPRRGLADLDEQIIWAAILLCGGALYLGWQLFRHHTLALALALG